jgi:hypothetical protein
LGRLTDSADILKEAEGNLNYNVVKNLMSPASIVAFSSLYYVLSTAKLQDYPGLQKFFISFLETDHAKNGIELASVHTAEEKVDASTVQGAAASPVVLPAKGGKHLKAGIFANQLDGKKMY